MKCTTCFGHGWWPYGHLVALGPIDAGDGLHSIAIKCPWCGVGVKKGERYEKLLKYKKEEEEKASGAKIKTKKSKL